MRRLLRFPAAQEANLSNTWPLSKKKSYGRAYRNTSALEVLQRLLPPGLAAALPPRATRPQIIGKVGVIRIDAAAELRNSRYLPLLGQVVLDKNPQLKTVALESPLTSDNSAGGGRDPYSLREWQIIAGVPSLRTTVIEHGKKFSVDLRSCFWNGKRGPERLRLAADIVEYCRVALQARADIRHAPMSVLVCDLTAGIGALAIHVATGAAAGSVSVIVAANDWNQAASAMAMHNRTGNLLTEQQLEVSSLPVADFVHVLATQPERWCDGGAVLILDAPRPEGISDLLHALRPLLQAHTTISSTGVCPAPLRLVFYAMAPPDMLTPEAWHARLMHEWAVQRSSCQFAVATVKTVRPVAKGWELVCVSVDWLACMFPDG